MGPSTSTKVEAHRQIVVPFAKSLACSAGLSASSFTGDLLETMQALSTQVEARKHQQRAWRRLQLRATATTLLQSKSDPAIMVTHAPGGRPVYAAAKKVTRKWEVYLDNLPFAPEWLLDGKLSPAPLPRKPPPKRHPSVEPFTGRPKTVPWQTASTVMHAKTLPLRLPKPPLPTIASYPQLTSAHATCSAASVSEQNLEFFGQVDRQLEALASAKDAQGLRDERFELDMLPWTATMTAPIMAPNRAITMTAPGRRRRPRRLSSRSQTSPGRMRRDELTPIRFRRGEPPHAIVDPPLGGTVPTVPHPTASTQLCACQRFAPHRPAPRGTVSRGRTYRSGDITVEWQRKDVSSNDPSDEL